MDTIRRDQPVDAALRKRLETALKESGFCLAPLDRTEHAVTITTPFIMPDGDHLSFQAVPRKDGGWVITDFGSIAGMTLFIRAHIGALPDSYEAEIQKVLGEYGVWHAVTFERGTLRLETTDERLPDALRHFAQMALHVAHVCSFGADEELDTG